MNVKTRKMLQELYILDKLQKNTEISNFNSIRRCVLNYMAISDGVFNGKYGSGGGEFQDCLTRLETEGKIVCRRNRHETHISLPTNKKISLT